MALHQSHPESLTGSHPIVFSAILAAILIALMLALTALLGLHITGPSLEIVRDPASVTDTQASRVQYMKDAAKDDSYGLSASQYQRDHYKDDVYQR